MVFGKLIADGYVCEDCGSTSQSRTTDCCDTCLLKFYFDNPNASSFADWREPDHSNKPDTDKPNLADLFSKQFDYFSKGFDAGADDVLTALAEFCHQGGSINAENVIAWVKTYELKSEKGE